MKSIIFALSLGGAFSQDTCVDLCADQTTYCNDFPDDLPTCACCLTDDRAEKHDAYVLENEVCAAAETSDGIYCGPEVEDGGNLCQIGDKLMEDLGNSDSTVIRDFVRKIFDKDSTMEVGDILKDAWQLLQDQALWLAPMIFLILFTVILIVAIPFTCCCFKLVCFRFRCKNVCFCLPFCYNSDDPNMAPRWTICKKTGMVGSMGILTIVGIAMVAWANLTFLPKMSDGVKNSLCEGTKLMNTVNYGFQPSQHHIDLALEEDLPVPKSFIGMGPAVDIFNGLVEQLDRGSPLRVSIQRVLDDTTPLDNALTNMKSEITDLETYSTGNLAVSNNILACPFIDEFPAEDIAPIKNELDSGVADIMLKISADLAEWFDGPSADDVRDALESAVGPVEDLKEQVLEGGSIFADSGKDAFDQFDKHSNTALMAVGAFFGIFIVAAFVISFVKVFVLKFDKQSFRDEDGSGGCYNKKRRHPFFMTVCAFSCFFSMFALFAGSIILLITIPVTETCSLTDFLLYPDISGGETPLDVLMNVDLGLPSLIPDEPLDDGTFSENFQQVMDITAACIAQGGDGNMTKALDIELDIGSVMDGVHTEMNKVTNLQDSKVADMPEYLDLLNGIDSVGYLWVWKTPADVVQPARFATEYAEFAANAAQIGTNTYALLFAAQAGDIISNAAAITSDDGTLYPIQHILSEVKANVAGLENFCFGVAGAPSDHVLGKPAANCRTPADIASDGNLQNGVIGSVDEAFVGFFGTQLVAGFEVTGYRCSASDTDCAAWEMQEALQNQRNSLSLSVEAPNTGLDDVTANMAQTMVNQILDDLDTYLVKPIQDIEEQIDCQFVGQAARNVLDEFCGNINTGLRGLATGWAVLGFVGVLASTIMFYIWHHLKSKYWWENTNAPVNADYEDN